MAAITRSSGGGGVNAWDVSQLVETRERQRIVGDVRVTPVDVLLSRTFPDTIVQGRSDFDSHGPSVDDVCYVSETVTNKVFWANMPYRSLIPEKLDGVAVAGIGISVHRDALPLLRMQPEVRNLGSRKFPNNMVTVLYLKNRPGTVLGIGARGFDTGLWRSETSGRVWEPVDARGLPPLVPGKSAASWTSPRRSTISWNPV